MTFSAKKRIRDRFNQVADVTGVVWCRPEKAEAGCGILSLILLVTGDPSGRVHGQPYNLSSYRNPCTKADAWFFVPIFIAGRGDMRCSQG